jgi:hypothetical protein
MTFHLTGWTQSQDSAVLVPVAALADQSVLTSGNDVIVPDDLPLIVGLYALGPNLTRAQVTSPSIRRLWTQEIFKLDLSATPTDQLLYNDHGDNPIVLDTDEALDANMAESAAGASRGTILVWLADLPPQPVTGDIRSIRFTSTTAVVANIWSNIPIAFNDSLPSGQYSIVGCMVQSANMQAFRLVPRGANYRPGFIGVTAKSQREHQLARFGQMGEWATFQHNVPPSLDILANGADAAFEGVMDLIGPR